jgi:hypothetical protein
VIANDRTSGCDQSGKDTHHEQDQGKPCVELVEDLLSNGLGPKGFLTRKTLAKMLAKRRVESRKTNGQYSQSFSHKMFGSSKYVVTKDRQKKKTVLRSDSFRRQLGYFIDALRW